MSNIDVRVLVAVKDALSMSSVGKERHGGILYRAADCLHQLREAQKSAQLEYIKLAVESARATLEAEAELYTPKVNAKKKVRRR